MRTDKQHFQITVYYLIINLVLKVLVLVMHGLVRETRFYLSNDVIVDHVSVPAVLILCLVTNSVSKRHRTVRVWIE